MRVGSRRRKKLFLTGYRVSDYSVTMKSVREDRQGRKDVFIFTQLQPQYIFGAISGAMYMYVLTGIISIGKACTLDVMSMIAPMPLIVRYRSLTRAILFPIGMPCGFQTIEHLIRGYMGMIWHEHGTFGE